MSVAMAVVTAMGGVFAFFVRVGMGMRAFIVSYRGGAVEPTHFEYVLFCFGGFCVRKRDFLEGGLREERLERKEEKISERDKACR